MKSLQPWQPLALNRTWSRLPNTSVLLFNDDDFVVVEYRRRTDGEHALRLQTSDGRRIEKKIPKRRTLAEEATARNISYPRAMVLPTTIWSKDALLSPRNLVATLAGASTMALITIPGQSMFYLAAMAGFGATAVVRQLWRGNYRVEFITKDTQGLTMATVHHHALAAEQGKLWVAPQFGDDRRALALRRVEAIRTNYLMLREDIVERIEHSALFDSAVATTAAFEEALAAFDDADAQTPTERLDELASAVEVNFNVAQAHARRVGLQHLPEEARADGRRACKAARLAAGATTDGERQASLAQVKRILDSLALYYLPTLDERLAITPPRSD